MYLEDRTVSEDSVINLANAVTGAAVALIREVSAWFFVQWPFLQTLRQRSLGQCLTGIARPGQASNLSCMSYLFPVVLAQIIGPVSGTCDNTWCFRGRSKKHYAKLG